MRIARVFASKTNCTPDDDMTFFEGPGLFRPEADEVHVNCVFTWDIHRAKQMHSAWSAHYPVVKIGGPAFGDRGEEFTPGLYTKHGITITSRGCTKKCGFCLVPRREGGIRELEIHPGNTIQDNNLLACSRPHVERVFEMLASQKAVRFSGGLDAGLLEDWHVDSLEKLSINEMWFACDGKSTTKAQRAAEMLSGFRRDQKRCYVLVGYNNEKPLDGDKRLQAVWDLGFLPFAQFYRGEGEQHKSREWATIVRNWSRPALTKSLQKARV